jgi:hypothetical protein
MLPNLARTDFHKLSGRTPWTGIAEQPSQYMSKRSRPDSDYQLEEPSHMKSDGVDTWLKHWLKLQKRNKRPLVLKDGSGVVHANPTTASRQKDKASKDQSIDNNNADDEAVDENHNENGSNTDTDTGMNANANIHANALPPTPLSASETRQTRRAFLATLSEDRHYQSLLLLLRAAKVNIILWSLTESHQYSGWRSFGGQSTYLGVLEIQ